MIAQLFLLLGGLALLVYCADKLVEECVAIAGKLHISPTVIGLTVVAFGTSLPELVFSTGAAVRGSGGLVIGNIVGSNLANTLLILGVAAAVRPIPIERNVLTRDGGFWALSTAIFAVSVFVNTQLGMWAGAALLLTLVVYLYILLRAGAFAGGDESTASEDGGGSPRTIVIVIASLAGIALGAELAIDSAIDLARLLGISEAVIGLSIIAIGTSLPELATAVVCVRRNQGGMLVGNIIGSNIFNILACIGVPAFFVGIAVPVQMLSLDFPVLIGTSVIALFMLRSNWVFSRVEGGVCLGLYGVYLGRFVMAP